MAVVSEQKLTDYLKRNVAGGDLTEGMARFVYETWHYLKRLGTVTMPDVGVGPDNSAMMVWNRGTYHLELELFPDLHGEWFYIDHATNELWEADYANDGMFDPRCATTLRAMGMLS